MRRAERETGKRQRSCGRRVGLAPLALAVALASGSPAGAQGSVVLYGAAGAPSTLYVIDPDTAAATPVGPIQVSGVGITVHGLAFLDDGRLVGSADGAGLTPCTGSACAVLVDVDTASGAASLLGKISDDGVPGQCGEIPDLAFDPSTRALFGAARLCNVPAGTDQLLRINPANGAAILVLETGATGAGNGLAREPRSGALFTAASPDFVRLLPDPVEAIGPLNGGAVVSALAFHPLTGELFGAETGSADSSLVTLDPATGALDFNVGPIRVDGVTLAGVDALAFQGPGGCSDAPLGSCTDAAKANLQLKAKRGRLKLTLKKLGETAKSEFGTPTSDTGYAVCVYETAEGANPTLVAGYTVPAGADWIEKEKGFQFKSKEGAPDRIRAVRLSAGPAGKAQVSVSGKQGVDVPDLPLASDTAVAQVVNDVGACFGAAVTAFLDEDNTLVRYKGIKPTPTPTATPTATATPSGSATASPSGSATPTPAGSVTATPSATPTPTAPPTNGGIVIIIGE